MADENHSSVQPIISARADTVVWLDLPKRTVMGQVTWRTLRRVAGREVLLERQPRALAKLLQLEPRAVGHPWAWHNHAEYRAHLRFVQLSSREAVSRFLDEARRKTARAEPDFA